MMLQLTLASHTLPTTKTHERDFQDKDRLATISNNNSTLKMADCTATPVRWNFRDVYKDEYTAEELPTAQLREAIVDEL